MEHFGERLRRLRGERSQKAIAEALAMPQTTLSSLEKQQSIPRGDVLKKLADFFGVPIAYFYTASNPTSSEAGKAWLEHLKSSTKGRDTIATHSPIALDSQIKEKIAEKLREKLNGQKI
jgi:transcriptional regulator with XRE-family HTH domain